MNPISASPVSTAATSCATRWCSASSTPMSAMNAIPVPTVEVQLGEQIDALPEAIDDQRLSDWAAAAARGAGGAMGEITLRIVSPEESRALNHDFRGKDAPTNVLSFPFEMPEGIPVEHQDLILGDIAICA